MSISPLVRVTLWGLEREKTAVLRGLQQLGCLHLEPLTGVRDVGPAAGASGSSRDALRYLLSCPHQRRQLTDPAAFDAKTVEQRALEIRREVADLRDEADALRRRISELSPWGDFDFTALEGRDDLRLWFYAVPTYQLAKVDALGVAYEVVARDHRFAYTIVVGAEEPKGMPVRRTHTGSRPLSQLERRLGVVELTIEDLEAERGSLTRWALLLARSLDDLDDEATLARASEATLSEEGIFAVAGWAPADQADALRNFAGKRQLVLETRAPRRDEAPPTLMVNRAPFDSGTDLVSFYASPGYWSWDPSATVLVAFTVFFAMILADAGYAALLAVVLAASWRKLGASPSSLRLRRLFLGIVGASVGFGILAGSYFGVTPHADHPLARLQVIDLADSGSAMLLSLALGAGHLVLANLIEAWRSARTSLAAALSPFGWALAIAGGFLYGVAHFKGVAALAGGSKWALIVGLVLVVVFAGHGKGFGGRVGTGLVALTKVTAAFGDVLSYLRLFALGFASAQLAVAFNNLARDLWARPGVGILLALVALVIGHGLNLILGIMSGVVHGLRLNLIEFFNWSVTEEGRPFSAFRRKGDDAWKTSS